MSFVMLLFAAVAPWTWATLLSYHSGLLLGAAANPVSATFDESLLVNRDDSPVNVCVRWAQQSAVVNGTLYLYGGQASTQPSQTENTWNNDFLTLDLTKSWNIASPPLKGLPQPSGPPPVALGYLWQSRTSLYLYGGQFSWKPPVLPSPFALWEYNIASASWIQHANPTTSKGDSAVNDGTPVQRAAEGAGVSVPSLGRGFYFGGHLDGYTTPNWPQSIWRVYLQSLLEYTFPGFSNSQVQALSNNQPAGSDGVYRNITEGGLQAQAGFTERADGLLVHVPGFSSQGILLALAGGTNVTFTQMNVIDIYDIATSKWYKQSTSGPTPRIRVNPCSVMAAAPDGSSYNIYMFGGQSLLPYGNQTLYNDMWILSLPSFTWIEVDMSQQSVPYSRSGHTCNVWNAQMVVVGGYVGGELSCDSPGLYVFDLSKLQWQQEYTIPAEPNGNNVSPTTNPLNQQPAQLYSGSSPGGIEGSYGYRVPPAVASVIGGGPNGGATLTAPVATATEGPLATGSPTTYDSQLPNGNNTNPNPSSSGKKNSGAHSTNVAAVVVGVICGLLFCVVCYLAFCAYVYRKQLQLYKNHVDLTHQQAGNLPHPLSDKSAFLGLPVGATAFHERGRSNSTQHMSSIAAGESGRESGSYHGSGTLVSPVQERPNTGGYQSVRRNSDQVSMDDLLTYQEPSFVGIMLNPRRSLRVVNRD